MELNNIKKLKGLQKSKKRIGRGIGSGKGGHTVGKGMKGQKSRTGYNLPIGFEGGQVPLYKKMPQLGGFKNPRAKQITTVNLNEINVFDEGTVVTPQAVLEKGLIKFIGKNGVKILSTGALKKKVELKGFIFSKSAKEKAEKAGARIS